MENLQHIMSVTRVKRDLLNLIKMMQEEDATIALTRNGDPVGVMMTMDRYQALLETIEVLGDKDLLRALKKSRKDFASGRVFTDRDVWED